MAKDYYNILGVAKNASKDEIKTAFRKLAHRYHPDKGGDGKQFNEINEAYQILTDDRKRAEYDTYGSTFGQGAPGGHEQGFGGFDFSGFNAQGFQDMEFDLGDVFGEFFGGRGGSRGGNGQRVKRGRDIALDLELPFAESIFGTERKMLISKTIACEECSGSGAKPGSTMISCATCNGKGNIHDTKRTLFGAFSTVRECDACHGKGEVPKEKCHSCAGEGVKKGREEIHIIVPPGIKDGEVIRFAGKGEAAPGGIAGDLYAKVHVIAHPVFQRDGNNLSMELNVKLSDALLGAEYKISTLDGEIKVAIPEGISHGEILRVRGKGIPFEKNKRGDLFVKIVIKLPKKLSKAARKAVEQLKEEGV